MKSTKKCIYKQNAFLKYNLSKSKELFFLQTYDQFTHQHSKLFKMTVYVIQVQWCNPVDGVRQSGVEPNRKIICGL